MEICLIWKSGLKTLSNKSRAWKLYLAIWIVTIEHGAAAPAIRVVPHRKHCQPTSLISQSSTMDLRPFYRGQIESAIDVSLVSATVTNRLLRSVEARKKFPEDHPEKISAIENYQHARNTCRQVITEEKEKSWTESLNIINEDQSSSKLRRWINKFQGKRRVARQQETLTLL